MITLAPQAEGVRHDRFLFCVHLREQFDQEDHSENVGRAELSGRRGFEEEEEEEEDVAGLLDEVAGRTRIKKPRPLCSETREGSEDTTLNVGSKIIRKCMVVVVVEVKTTVFLFVSLFFDSR